MSTAATERMPEPATRFPKIDGAHIATAPPPKREPTIVPAEITPEKARVGGVMQTVLLVGGPHDGQEARVWRKAKEHRVTVPRQDYGPPPAWEPDVPGQKPNPKIVPGDFDVALYLRTDERDDEGRVLFEYEG